MLNSKYIFTLVLALYVTFGWTQPKGYTPIADKAAFEKNLAAAAQKTQTIDSDFTQKKYLSFLSEEIETEGHLAFKKENKLRWEYTEPFEYQIIINNGKMRIKDEEQVSNFDLQSSDVFQKVNDMILSSVSGDVLDEKTYEIRLFQGTKGYFAELKPKEANMKEFLAQIDLYFNMDYTVDQIIMIEPSGDYTYIVFKNKKLNTPIADEKFAIH